MSEIKRELHREEIRQLIAVGHVLVLYRQKEDLVVLRLNNWLDKHPGLTLPVLHFGELVSLWPSVASNA